MQSIKCTFTHNVIDHHIPFFYIIYTNKMPTTEEILESLIKDVTKQTAKLETGFKVIQAEMQTGFTKVQAQINSLNNTFQRNLPLLMFESIQEITKAVEESTFDWNVWTPSQESSLLSLGTFLSHYGCKVEGYDDIVIRQIFSSTFPQGLCQIDNKVMAGVLLASDVYTERKPEAPMQPRKRGRTSYLQSVDGKVKKSLVSFNEPEQEFPKTTEYGTTTLKRILENITKKDTEWDPSRLTRLECSQRVRLYYLDSILSVLLMIEGRFLSIRDEISLESGMVAKFDMLVMERDTNYYVIEVKEYPLFDEEQISTDLSKLLYQDFPQKNAEADFAINRV